MTAFCQSVPLKMMIMMITSIPACDRRPLYRWCWWHRCCCCCCWCSTLKRSGSTDWVPSDGTAGPSLLTRRGQRKHWTVLLTEDVTGKAYRQHYTTETRQLSNEPCAWYNNCSGWLGDTLYMFSNRNFSIYTVFRQRFYEVM